MGWGQTMILGLCFGLNAGMCIWCSMIIMILLLLCLANYKLLHYPADKSLSHLCTFSSHWCLCLRNINFFSHVISPFPLTNLVMGCFDFSSLPNPLPVALHDGQAQYCAWHLQPALVGSSFSFFSCFFFLFCNLVSLSHWSSKSNCPIKIIC